MTAKTMDGWIKYSEASSWRQQLTWVNFRGGTQMAQDSSMRWKTTIKKEKVLGCSWLGSADILIYKQSHLLSFTLMIFFFKSVQTFCQPFRISPPLFLEVGPCIMNSEVCSKGTINRIRVSYKGLKKHAMGNKRYKYREYKTIYLAQPFVCPPTWSEDLWGPTKQPHAAQLIFTWTFPMVSLLMLTNHQRVPVVD